MVKTMDKQHFIKFMARRYGIEDNQAECMADMFLDCLQDLIIAGESVNIDEIGEFKSTPLFPNATNSSHWLLNQINNKRTLSFKPSQKLLEAV